MSLSRVTKKVMMSTLRVTKKVMMSLSRLFPRSNSSFFLCSVLFFFLFSTFLLVASYYLCLQLDSLQSYSRFLERLAFSLGGKALSLSLRGLGCSGALALPIYFLFCISSSSNMMAPAGDSGASGSGSGEGAGGSSFRWTSLFSDLFGSSSPANSEAGLNQPAPDSPNPGEPAAPPIAEPYHPLQEDGERRRELTDRLLLNSLGSPLNESRKEEILEAQFQIELKVEEALRSDRVREESLFAKRHQIRGELFYPFGKPLSKKTYLDHLSQIKNYGTHRSQPYKRLFQAIARQDLDLVFEGIKKRRDW